MRKPSAALLVVVVLLVLGMAGVAPLSAAGGTSCKTASGTMAFSPTLPKLGSSSKVFAKLSLNGAMSACSGGNVSSGQLKITTPTSKTAINCATLASYSSKAVTGSELIAWSSGDSSTINVKLLDVKGSPTMKRIQGTVSAGLFKGLKQTGLIQYSLPSGGCTKAGFSKASFRAVNPLTIK